MPIKLSERDVTAAVKGWLEAKGWYAIRLQSGLVRGNTRGTFIRLGENGLPDWVFLRAWKGYPIALMVEMKAGGKKPGPDQVAFEAKAKRMGLTVLWCDSLEMFIEKYERFMEGLK